MRITHKLNLALCAIAFGIFVANQWFALSGQHLAFDGPAGASVLAGFLALGMVVQIAKIIEGHESALEFVLTVVQVGLHVYAELAIWYRTQLTDLGLPEQLPLLIIGLYWVVGLVDIGGRYLGREMRLFGKGYKSDRARLDELFAEREVTQARLELFTQRAQIAEERVEQLEVARDRVHELFCDVPSCGWSTGPKATAQAASNSLRAHTSRAHPVVTDDASIRGV